MNLSRVAGSSIYGNSTGIRQRRRCSLGCQTVSEWSKRRALTEHAVEKPNLARGREFSGSVCLLRTGNRQRPRIAHGHLVTLSALLNSITVLITDVGDYFAGAGVNEPAPVIRSTGLAAFLVCCARQFDFRFYMVLYGSVWFCVVLYGFV